MGTVNLSMNVEPRGMLCCMEILPCRVDPISAAILDPDRGAGLFHK